MPLRPLLAVLMLALASATSAVRPAVRDPGRVAPGDTTPTSSDWLALLPEGEAKRKFILDCTGCHQFDARIARPGGQARTEAQWEEAVTRMLRYGGARGSFPVIASDREAKATAAWLAGALGDEVARPGSRPGSRHTSARWTITEFPMPQPRDLPHDVAVTGDGRVVITGMFTHAMWVLDPATGRMDSVAIPVARANPRSVEIAPDGAWWVALGQPKSLARYDTASRQWRVYDAGVYPHSVAVGADGRAWFNGHFTRAPEVVGWFGADSSVRRYDVTPHPTLADDPGGPTPYEIRVAPDGRLWGSELHGNRLFAVDPRDGRVETFDMPAPHMGPRRFDVDARGIVWIPAYTTNELVRLDPAARGAQRFTRIPLPTRDAVPYVARVDAASGRVWVGAGAADALFAYDPATRRWETIALPTRGALVRHLAFDPRTRDVWVAYGASPGIDARIARVQARR
jgi:streptogramin lyase